jgi:hypothetical protein
LGVSSAKLKADSPASSPAARTIVALAAVNRRNNDRRNNDLRRERLPARFVIFEGSCS